MSLRSTDEVWRLLIAEYEAVPAGEGIMRAKCKFHDDTSGDSLYISRGDKGIVVHCHSGGCPAHQSPHLIYYECGISKKEMFYEQYRFEERAEKKSRKPKGEITATFDYRDEAGEILFRVARYETKDGKKDFKAQSKGKDGKWKNSIKRIRRVLYRLPEFIAADPSLFVLIVEGEKHVDRLWELGFIATCNPGGAEAWRKEYNESFRSRHTVILPDNDAAGELLTSSIASGIQDITASIRILRLAGLKDKGDVIDWLDAGGTTEQLQKLIAECPLWNPDEEKPTVITNYLETGDGREPLTMDRILANFWKATDNWPRRISETLFIPHARDGTFTIRSKSSLIEFVSDHTIYPPKFATGTGMHTKDEVFSAMERRADSYKQIEHYPHEPIITEHYYICQQPQPGDGNRLEDFVNFFLPHEPEDRDIIKVFAVTPFWGGDGGERPLFVVTSDFGRGSGKTKLVEKISLLCGGLISASSRDKMDEIKKRLLNRDGSKKRMVLFDNVKSLRFSWPEFESIVTARDISGWELFKGDASRPNTITWTMTINGASFGTDIAQRALIIKLRKPPTIAKWSDQIEAFIKTYREEIVADCIGFLKLPIHIRDQQTRWNVWERAMLHRLPQSNRIVELIHNRQGVANVEQEEGLSVEDYFRSKLDELGYTVDHERIWIPSEISARWMNEALGERKTVSSCSRSLRQKITEGEISNLEISKDTSMRGFVWCSPVCSTEAAIDNDLKWRTEHQQK